MDQRSAKPELREGLLLPWWRPIPIIVLPVFLAYLNSQGCAFQLDDYTVIVFDGRVHSWAAWLNDLGAGIRPFLKLTYLINWISGPADARGFHLFNTLVHGANCLLVFSLTLRFPGFGPSLSGGARNAVALGTALLFGLHPIQTEAVTYISGRSISLMTFFYLSSLAAYDRGTTLEKRRWLSVASPLLFALALLTKEVALTLPVALILWESSSFSPTRATMGKLIRRIRVHLVVAVAASCLIALHSTYGGLISFSIHLRSIQQAFLSAVHGFFLLLSHLVLVTRLNIDPELPILSQWTPTVALETALLAALVIGALTLVRRQPVVAFAVLWLCLHSLVVYALLPRTDVLNERHFYLGIWGLFMAFSWAAVRMSDRLTGRLAPAVASVVGLSLILGGFTVLRNEVYRTEVSLWKDAAAKSPSKARVINNLGYAYYLAGRDGDARQAYERALELDPRYVLARNNLALLSQAGPVHSSRPPPSVLPKKPFFSVGHRYDRGTAPPEK